MKKINKIKLIFHNYKNIGIGEKETLLLSTTNDSSKIGNLLILIGPNNSGKSNILKAISKLNSKILDDEDITENSFDEKDRKPKITLESNIYDNDEIILDIELDGYSYWSAKYYKKIVDTFKNVELNNFNFDNELKSKLVDLQQRINIENFADNIRIKYNEFDRYGTSRIVEWELIPFLEENGFLKDDINEFFPKVHIYNEELKFTQKDFSSPLSSLEKHTFYKLLFEKLNIDLNQIKLAYENYKQKNNKGVLKEIEEKINLELKKISKDFNKMYSFMNEKDKYKFEIDIESEKMDLILSRNKKSFTIDSQSTGFKYFFNLYFSLLSSNKTKSGDILIIDEPGTNLHVSGQKELRKFLKDFAISKNILIVISTHSPFLIDLDNLDELRIVSVVDNKVKIANKFHAINDNDNDVIFSIKKALTVENHIIVDPNNYIIFVEGITDYNYLTAMKKIFSKNNKEYKKFFFIPINGLGKNKDEMIEISKKILSIRKSKFIILVDNDKIGNDFLKVNNPQKSSLNVITIGELDKSFKTIESLFDKNDLEKWNLKNGKSFENSVFFKINANDENISSDTKKNFKKLFDFISKKLN